MRADQSSRRERPSPLAQGTLGRRLALRFATIIAAVSLALTAVCLLALGRALDAQLEEQATSLALQTWSSTQTTAARLQGNPGAIIVRRQTDGTVAATIMGPDRITPREVPENIRQILLDLPTDGRIHHVDLPGLGSYKIWSGDVPPAGVHRAEGLASIAAGEPTSPNVAFLGTVAIIMALFALAAIGLAVTVVRRVIGTSLHTLTELAESADRITAMNLAVGEVDLRVPEHEMEEAPSVETRRVATAFNHMIEHIRKALVARQLSESKVRRFVADASHELRNPLAAIRGYSEIGMRTASQLPPDVAFAMGRIDAESARMQRLVEDLLTLARLDASPDMVMARADVTEIVIGAVADARVADDGHIWRLELPQEPITAEVHAHGLHQVMVNLLTNARVHTPEGTTVWTRLSVDGDDAVVAVANNGPQIPPEKMDLIFERFGRLDESRARKGPGSTGLGLAIVRSLVEAHDGTLTVTSTPEETCFTVRLPREHRAAPAAAH